MLEVLFSLAGDIPDPLLALEIGDKLSGDGHSRIIGQLCAGARPGEATEHDTVTFHATPAMIRGFRGTIATQFPMFVPVDPDQSRSANSFYPYRQCKEGEVMARLFDKPFDVAGELKFRNGFVHGAQAVSDAVESHLTTRQAVLLRRWMANHLYPWQIAGGGIVEPPAAPDLFDRTAKPETSVAMERR